jgi:hypothetical protein
MKESNKSEIISLLNTYKNRNLCVICSAIGALYPVMQSNLI